MLGLGARDGLSLCSHVLTSYLAPKPDALGRP
jgi:hypothetical protein